MTKTVTFYENTLSLIQKLFSSGSGLSLRKNLIETLLDQSEEFQNRMLKIITNIEDQSYSEVCLQNWSQYVEGKSSNGGGYYFGKRYIYDKSKNRWLKQYETSADMAFCPVCGRFGDHEEYDEETGEFLGYTCGEEERYIHSKVLANSVARFMLGHIDDEDYYVYTKR